MKQRRTNPKSLANLQRSKPMGDEPLAAHTLSFKTTEEIDKYIQSRHNSSEWLRDAVAEKYYAETSSKSSKTKKQVVETSAQSIPSQEVTVTHEALQIAKETVLKNWKVAKAPEKKERIEQALDKLINAVTSQLEPTTPIPEAEPKAIATEKEEVKASLEVARETKSKTKK
ncbi:MAG: hypothetical protein KME29_09615 [Calothrix sp. FI2-JRJ7]|jgi:predicted RNase H-like nuclease|nr:hypothetical protein [Calothrix sp. FI2-JRJ7]